MSLGAPADQADLQVGDIVLKVGDAPAIDLASMFRQIWALGPVGTVIPLTVSRDGHELRIDVRSADRNAFLKSPGLH